MIGKGDRVKVYNRSLDGRCILEGVATLKSKTKFPGRWLVRFDSEPGRAYTRFVSEADRIETA